MQQAALNPTLPQNDTPAQQVARTAQLATAQATWQWTTSIPTLPGAPLSQAVPKDDQPTLDWFLLLGDILLKLIDNRLHITLPPSGSTSSVEVQRNNIAADMAAIRAHHGATMTGGSLFGRGLAALEASIDNLEHATHLARMHEHVCALKSLLDGLDDGIVTNIEAALPSLEAYRALFAVIDVPAIAYEFQEDSTFARLRVAGPNAVLLKAVGATLPSKFGLTSAQYAAVVNGDTLAAALSEQRLFICDYEMLSTLIPNSWNGLNKYVPQPIALFAVPPGGSSLVPVAIQLGQAADTYPIFTPTVVASDKWGWELAKLMVQVADGNYHELFAHLAHTHLVIESVAVATHRHLAAVHPVWGLLVPHFEGTLFINEAAATSLITKGGPIDQIFGGKIESSQKTAVAARLDFDFEKRMLPHDLAERGVGINSTLTEYPYRDDAMLVWEAIAAWAGAYVEQYYASDSDVTGDTELAAWVSALQNIGNIKGFPMIDSRAMLVKVCTMVIFTASAQHAAVNFPQKTIMEFAPAVTGAAWAPVPTAQSGNDRADWLAAMPPVQLAWEQLKTLYLLGSLYYRPLGTYLCTDAPYPQWFQDPAIIGADGLLADFQAALQSVDSTIEGRNAARQYPYPHLQPSLIPTSINI